MNWKEYERSVFDELALVYPGTNIQHDVKLPGRFSKTARQVDIHIGGIVCGVYYQIVVDTKYYEKKIDVKDIEEFIGMLGDIDCNHGMLITEQGFTPAAANRAANNPFSVSIDIISFAELKEYQTSAGVISFTERYGLIIRPPLGWVIDDRSETHAYLCSLYNRGFQSKEEAFAAENAMYIAIAPKSAYPEIDDLFKSQEIETIKRLPKGITFEYRKWKSSEKREYRIRSIYGPGKSTIEITGVVEFPTFYCCVVLLTPLTYMKVNFPRLIWVMDGLFGMEKEPEVKTPKE